MSKSKTDRNKQRVKLYKKVRNTSSWGSTIVYLLLIVLFIGMVVFLAGFVIEYIFESKFAHGYEELERTAKLYEAGIDDKSIMDYVFTDSEGERAFAEDLDAATEVCVYAKLPRSFQIPTPVGNYAPDWAIAFNKGAVKHIFFIAETKGSMDSMQLKEVERAKIGCAEKLFNNLSTSNVRYHKVDSYQTLLDIMKSMD